MVSHKHILSHSVVSGRVVWRWWRESHFNSLIVTCSWVLKSIFILNLAMVTCSACGSKVARKRNSGKKMNALSWSSSLRCSPWHRLRSSEIDQRFRAAVLIIHYHSNSITGHSAHINILTVQNHFILKGLQMFGVSGTPLSPQWALGQP